MKNLHVLACLAVPSILAATAACGDPDCSVTKTCNVGGDTTSSGGASTTTSSAQGGAGGTSSGAGGMSSGTGTGGMGGGGPMSGDVIWQQQFGDASNDGISAMSIDSENNIYVVGTFEGAITIGGTTLTSAGGEDVFVAKLASTGGLIWAKRFGDASAQTGDFIDVGGNALVIGGSYRGSPSFDGDALSSSNSTGWYVANLSTSSGNANWASGVANVTVHGYAARATDLRRRRRK